MLTESVREPAEGALGSHGVWHRGAEVATNDPPAHNDQHSRATQLTGKGKSAESLNTIAAEILVFLCRDKICSWFAILEDQVVTSIHQNSE